MEPRELLITGGSGLLGSALRPLLPDALYPAHTEFDVTEPGLMNSYMESKNVKWLIHGAAFTSPPKINADPDSALRINVVGTANVVRLCRKLNIKLIYICTDYVFSGDQGNYKEDDPVLPVNKYAWSKLGGECAVRMYDNSLIIRTSFGANDFPYEKAFVDQWTSRLTVREFAQKLIRIIDSDATGVVHIGGPRRTVFEYAKAISPKKAIGPLSLKDVSFAAPKDTSLDTSKYDSIVNTLKQGS